MADTNYYCAGSHCRRTTQRVRVRMAEQTYYYCVECGRRLEETTPVRSAAAGLLDEKKAG